MTVPTPPSDSASSISSCFVIGPIGDRLAAPYSEGRQQYEQAMQIWDYAIQPAVQQALGIEPTRADMIAEAGEITEQVCQRLRDDDLVIADVTGGNPNVMYELGMRHTKNKLTIQLGEKERLPFDITVIRTIQFNRNESGLVEARDRLEQAIRMGVERGNQPVTATRIWLQAEGDPELVEYAGKLEGQQEKEEPGFLDMLAEAEEAAPLIGQVTNELTTAFEGLNPLTDEMMREIAQSDARGGGAGGRLRVTQNFAQRLEDPTNNIEQAAADFVSELTRMAPGISYQIGAIEETPSILENDEGARQFADSIKELALVAGESLAQVGVLADVVQDLGKISNTESG